MTHPAWPCLKNGTWEGVVSRSTKTLWTWVTWFSSLFLHTMYLFPFPQSNIPSILPNHPGPSGQLEALRARPPWWWAVRPRPSPGHRGRPPPPVTDRPPLTAFDGDDGCSSGRRPGVRSASKWQTSWTSNLRRSPFASLLS